MATVAIVSRAPAPLDEVIKDRGRVSRLCRPHAASQRRLRRRRSGWLRRSATGTALLTFERLLAGLSDSDTADKFARP
jgi:hypothetical protein